MTEELQTRTVVPPRFQFSPLSMFAVTTAVAVVCSLAFSMSDMVAIPLFLLFSVVLTAVLITIIVYGRGYQRTFCIGAVVPFGVLLLTLGFVGAILFLEGPRTQPSTYRLVVCGCWLSSLLVGVVCVGVRWLVERRPASPADQGNIDPSAKDAVAALTELLKDKDENVRQAAAAALVKINEEKQ